MSAQTDELLKLSEIIEDMLVERNLRGMGSVQHALTKGYVLRAVQLMLKVRGRVLIGTGFPVGDTYETDGPVGAIALYQAFEELGAEPTLVCGPPMSNVLQGHYRVHNLIVGPHEDRDHEAQSALEALTPELVISIERPGMAEDGHYYNMRGENISEKAACFDSFFAHANCPTIAIGDGGNEIGMGNIREALKSLDINPAQTGCTELIIADVSNWAALGLIALAEFMTKRSLLSKIDSLSVLEFLSNNGSVDGVTRQNTLTEDGLDAKEGIGLLDRLKQLVSDYSAKN